MFGRRALIEVAVPLLFVAGCSKAHAPVATGQLQFEIVDRATQQQIPGRVTLIGVGRSLPRLSRVAAGEETATFVAVDNRVLSRLGHGQLDVPTGTYDVYVSRGLEWSLVSQRVTVTAGGATSVRAELDHAVTLPGWISADFHVHAERSWDSTVPMTHRIHEFLAEGIDVIVSTDHNVVADYGPAIADLGVGDQLASVIGDELTTLTFGHAGVFPLPASWVGKTFGIEWRHHHVGDLVPKVRAAAPDALIQINHPRHAHGMGYFTTEGYDPATDETAAPGYSRDFDAIELLNGDKDAARVELEEVLVDWFHLLDHGYVVTATGNSDTHTMVPNAGYPRNYVQTVATADHDPRSPAAIADALRHHRAFFTTGPLVTMTVGTAGIGDIAPARGTVLIDVQVFAAPWISVNRVRLYVGGKVVETIPLDPDATTPLRLQRTLQVTVAKDSYVVLRVDGDRPMVPVIPGVAHALTNPIFLDADGDGRYTPPRAPR